MSRQQALDFLTSGARTGKLATASPSGTAHVVPVWFVMDGDDVVFATGYESLKGRHCGPTRVPP
jgi:nitroimidazol reductase NimA-like FMN-containing flavoprotein (pyridoxamine 5'-phosphate oxidase superfamily)